MANQIIVSEDRNQITVVEGETRIVEVVTQGPQGPVGPIGPQGPSGSSILNQITSGSVTASVDIGPTIFSLSSGSSTYLTVSSSGSLSVNGNTTIQGNQFNAGTYWRAISGSNFPVGPFRGIAYGNGLFVAIADRGASGTSNTTSITTSPDGVNWTFRTIPSLTGLTNIIYQNGIFVAVGRVNQRGFYSYDGINWFNTTGINGIVFNITYGKDKFVASKIDNASNRIDISYDGKTWQGVSTPSTMDIAWTGITYGDDKYVAVAESSVSGSIAISYDGLTWNNVTRPSAGVLTTYNITYGKGLFVVTCNQGKIMTSPDGVTWTVRDTPLTGLIWKCIFADGIFIAAGCFSTTENKFIYSTDGITWQVANTPSLNNWGGFAYGNGLLVAISYNGPDTGSLIVSSGVMNSFTAQNDNRTHGRQIFTDDLILSNSPISQSSGFKLDVSGSSRFAGNTTITGSLTVTDTITAQRLVVQTITSSTSYITGSTIFGSLSTNTHQFTGSVFVSGSVGIGTNSPLSALDINEGSLLIRRAGNNTTPARIIFQGGNGGNGQIYVDQNMTVFTSTAGISISAIFGISNIDFGSNKGSAALPLIRGTNNVQAGIFFAEYGGGNPGGVAFSTSNLERARFTPTGNLLLGLTTDDTVNRLQISGSSRFIGNTVISGSTTITSGLSVGNGATISGQTNINIASGTNFTLSGAIGGSLSYAYASYFGSTYAAILSGANVGLRGTSTIFLGNNDALYTMVITGDKVALGHTSPTALLHISGSTGGLLEIDSPALPNILFVSASGNVGIGTNAPDNALTINVNSNSGNGIKVTNTNTGNQARAYVSLYNNSGNGAGLSIWGTGTSYANKTIFESSKDFIIATDTSVASGGTSKFQISVGGYNAVTTPQLSFHATANLSIGSTSDNGQRLQIYGDTLLRGSGATSATTALTVQNSDGTNMLLVNNSGYYKLSGTNGMFLSMFTTSGGSASISGTNTQFFNYTTTQAATSGVFLFTGDNFQQTSGAVHTVFINKGFIPTSGNASFSNLTIATNNINQQGGANGITRGLYVNPTLTSAADWRSIEWSNNAATAPSASWGLYGAGTAPNYLAGGLGIGTTSVSAGLTVWNSDIFIKSDRFIGASNTEASYNSVWNRIQLYNGSNGDMSITLHSAAWWLRHNANMSIAGNTLIGLTSSSGERLQVSGSSRFQGDVVISGSGATSSTNALRVVNSGGTALLTLRNDGLTTLSNSVIGAGALAAGGGSVAFITNATVGGNLYAAAIGYNAQASNAHAIAIGYDAVASANPSFAIGRTAIASGPNSTAFSGATANGSYSVAFGIGSISSNTGSFTIGTRSYGYLPGQLSISSNNMTYVGDSQHSIVTRPLNTGVVTSASTFSFAGIRPSNGTFSSDVSQIWLVKANVILSVRSKNAIATEFSLEDTYTSIHHLVVKSRNSVGTSIIGTPNLISLIGNNSMTASSVTFSISASNLVTNITPPSWVTGSVEFRGTVSYELTEVGVYAQNI